MFKKGETASCGIEKSFWISKRNVSFVAIFYTFLWGSAFPLVKICMENFSVSENDNMSKCLIAGIRFFFSGCLTLAIFRLLQKGQKRVTLGRRHRIMVCAYGIMGTAFQYAFTYIGLTYVAGSKGAVLDQMSVFLVVLASGLFFKNDRLNVFKVLGCIFGFTGIMVSNLSGFDLNFTLQGEGVMILAAIFNAIAYFLAKKTSEDIPAMLLVGYGQLIGGILLCAFGFFFGGRVTSVTSGAIASLIMLIFISSVAYVLSLMPLQYHPASEISSFQLLITVFGAIMSAALLRENILKWNYILAFALVASGIYMVNYTKRTKCII